MCWSQSKCVKSQMLMQLLYEEITSYRLTKRNPSVFTPMSVLSLQRTTCHAHVNYGGSWTLRWHSRCPCFPVITSVFRPMPFMARPSLQWTWKNWNDALRRKNFSYPAARRHPKELLHCPSQNSSLLCVYPYYYFIILIGDMTPEMMACHRLYLLIMECTELVLL
nr:uncharacterized protein LOC128706180 [Cherax quadricarinatus]